MTLNELKQQRDADYTVLQDISRERNTRLDEMISAARRIIDADIAALYGDRLDAAQEAYTIAYRAHLAALEAHALTGAGCPVPLGTKLVKWEIPKSRSWMRGISMKVVAHGVVEAITGQSVHPSNMAEYSRAKIGAFVVRHLKKDGTPSARYDKLHWSRENDYTVLYGWHPEGVDPNKERA